MNPRRALLLSLAAVLPLVACRAAPAPEIRIGLLATFSGPYATGSGLPARDGAALAVATAEPVVLNGVTWQVRLVERDFADRGDAAAGAARALVNQDSVHALIGPPFSRHALPVAVVADDAGVPMITTMASSPPVTAGRRWVFRLAFLDDAQGRALAQFAHEDLGARTAAVLYDVTTDYSRDVATRFREAFEAAGGRVAAFEAYTADRVQDLDAAWRRIRAAAPRVILLPNRSDHVSLQLPRARALGIRAVWLGSDSWDPPGLPPFPAAESAFVTNQWRPDIPLATAAAFNAAYRAAYDADPRATAAMTYDAVRILLDAIRRAGTLEPGAVRETIAATTGWSGATGMISFDGRADPRRAVAVSRLSEGALTTVRLVDP